LTIGTHLVESPPALSFRVVDLNALPLRHLFTELTSDKSLTRLLELARDEDLGPGGVPGDLTSRVIIEPRTFGSARVVSRATGVLAGGACIPAVLALFAPAARADHHIADGRNISPGDCVATITGPVDQLLQAERTLLNLVSRLSGIATRTARFVELVKGTRARLLDTRKTTPGLRNLEKYAVRCGGGFCHRLGLFDAVLIKDNHIAHIPSNDLAKTVAAAADKARTLFPGAVRFIELEVDRLDQLGAVLSAGGAGVDIVLLDNMPAMTLAEAVRMRDRAGASVLLEASGGVTLDTIRAIAETGVDRISVGGLTHQATSLDLGLDIA
jgi:nicotinate-nucleotide pyrophosphorylase (carboxylating)